MLRFSWLQTRTQTLVASGLLAAVAVVAAITGVQLSHLFHSSVAHCTSGCGFAINQFLSRDSFMDHTLDLLARAAPVLLGMFWGAPLLARELETGTYRLAWTQSVPRARWLMARLAVGLVATMTVAALLTLTITWWYTSRDQVGGSEPFAVFDRRDVVPVAYAGFAFAVGALVGAVVRRTVPAMAATLGLFIAVRVAVSLWVRPHFMTPVRTVLSLSGLGETSRLHLGLGSTNGGAVQLFVEGGGPPRSWTLSNQLLTGAGQRPSSGQVSAFLHDRCPDFGPPPLAPPGGGIRRVVGPDAGRACMEEVAKTFHAVVTYQPVSRYWAFQWIEAGLFAALALAAVAGCYWWVTRRAT